MATRTYCQSCGMPLKGPDDLGTEAGMKKTVEYCKNCYQNGAFTEPEITREEMILRVAKRMNEEMGMAADEAANVAVALIPRLKRWQ